MEEEKEEDIIEKRKEILKTKLNNLLEDPYNKAFLIVLIIAFAIRLWIFFKTLDQAVWYDAANYLNTAKKWAGLTPNIPDTWYYRRGFFWPLFSAFFYWTGLGETTLRFIMVLFSTGIVATSYFLVKDIFNEKLALATSIGLALSWVLLFFTGRPLTSIPATFFLLLSLLFFWKGYFLKRENKFLYLFAVFFALAILTRMQYLMFVPPILIFIFVKERFMAFTNKSLWITLGIFLLVMSPYAMLSWPHYGNPITDLMSFYLGVGQSKTGAVGGGTHSIAGSFKYFIDLPYILYNPIFWIFLIGAFYFLGTFLLGIDKIFKNERMQRILFVLLLLIIPIWLLGYVTPGLLEQRYIIPMLPFLFLVVSMAFFKVKDFSVKYLNLDKKLALVIMFILLTALMIPNLLWANQLTEVKKTSYYPLKEAGFWLKKNSEPEDIVMSNSMPYVMYYAERYSLPINKNMTKFEEEIEKFKPRFLLVSIFEHHDPWMYEYPQKHNNTLIPIQAYTQGDQPLLIIYEFNYSKQ